MAVQFEAGASRLVLTFQVGVDDMGNPLTQSRSLNNVKPDATDQELYDVAVALAALQVHPVVSVERVNQGQLINL